MLVAFDLPCEIASRDEHKMRPNSQERSNLFFVDSQTMAIRKKARKELKTKSEFENIKREKGMAFHHQLTKT